MQRTCLVLVVALVGPVAAHDAHGALAGLELDRSTVAGCKSFNGTVSLTAPAPTGGLRVTLTDTLASATAPLSVTIPEGALSKKFLIKTTAVMTTQSGVVTATLEGTTLSQNLAVRPIGLLSLALAPATVVGSHSVTGTAKLECRAGPGPITVELGSSRPASANPVATSVVIPVGLQSQPFGVTTSPVQSNTTVLISGNTGSTAKSKSMTLTPAATISPTRLTFGPQRVLTTSAPLEARLGNSGAVPFSVTGIALADDIGNYRNSFKQTNNCGAMLSAGKTCRILVKFAPGFGRSEQTAKLVISTSARSSPLVVKLSGTMLDFPF